MSNEMTEHCPKCGRFLDRPVGTLTIRGLEKVEADCKKHGKVDITETTQLGYDEFAQGKTVKSSTGIK